jgi:hypothetical protein
MQLMSTRQITDHDCRVILDPDVCYIQYHRTGHLVGTGPRRRDSQRLWELDWLRLPSAALASLVSSGFAASSTSLFAQWHHRLGHLCGSRLSTFLCRGFFRVNFSSRVFRSLSRLSIGKAGPTSLSL